MFCQFLNGYGNFVPLLQMVVSLDSKRMSEKVKLKHFLVGEKRILTGFPKITGHNSKLVLEERPGQLLVMIEQLKQKSNKKVLK